MLSFPNRLSSINEGVTTIKVICDDIDVFAFLTNFYYARKLEATVLMEGTSANRNVVRLVK